MDLNAYMTAARTLQGIPSDNQLATALGITRGRVSSLRHGHWMPSDELMARIAELAGENVELALLRLNYWRTRNGAARATYRRMIERLGGATIALALGFTGLGTPVPARASVQENREQCILWNRRRRETAAAVNRAPRAWRPRLNQLPDSIAP